MLCDKCKKNEATVHIKEFHGGKCVTTNLCAECAAKHNEAGEFGDLGFNLAEILFNVGKFSESLKEASAGKTAKTTKDSPEPPGGEKDSILRCPGCNWSAKDIHNANGKLGCPECYHTFASMLSHALKQVHKGQCHLGKHPLDGTPGNSRAKLNAEIKQLQKELAILVSREEYEDAAVCRDRINALKHNLEQLTDER
ncbi:MAG: UvrB/UvrC motif-containing protein [Lentisphaeria bacterium]|nr:UvrB/UvrC motif-containing protein [Lentisphaeria bacterium]